MPGVNDWLKKASNDLKACKKLSDDDDTLDCSAFHAHQCAEKSFKAFIVFTKQAIPKTHDLKFLLESCAKFNSELMFLLEESKSLDSYGYASRYPNDYFYVDKPDIEEAVERAEKILITIKKKISKK